MAKRCAGERSVVSAVAAPAITRHRHSHLVAVILRCQTLRLHLSIVLGSLHWIMRISRPGSCTSLKTSSGTLSTQPQRSLSSTHDGRVSPRPTGTKIWSSTWSAPRACPPGFTGPGAVERLPGRPQDAPIRSEFEKVRANYARKVMVEDKGFIVMASFRGTVPTS